MSKYKRVPKEDTKPERFVRRVLEMSGVSFKSQWPVKTRFREWPFSTDFLVLDELVIEVQGDYWHKKKSRLKKDPIKKACLIGEGYLFADIWESEIKKYPISVRLTLLRIIAALKGKPYIPKEPSPF